jgi:hypothetical protein
MGIIPGMPISLPQVVDPSAPKSVKLTSSRDLGAKEEAWLQRFENNPHGLYFFKFLIFPEIYDFPFLVFLNSIYFNFFNFFPAIL